MKKIFLYLLPLAFIILLPIALRKPAEAIDTSADQLVIITPNNEAIRHESEQAFRKYYHERTGRNVSIDWRDVGGTGDIVRYVDSAFTANFRQHWTEELGKAWSDEVSIAFKNPALSPKDNEARKAFLESNVGIGIDIFFGGGQYDFNKQARIGTLVPCGLRERHPELFSGPRPILESAMGGEIWFDKNDRYYATCFSCFGICFNLDRMKALGFDISHPETIATSWTLLADTRLFGEVGMADPTKSGSVNKCFEMLVQQQMQETYKRLSPRIKEGSLTEKQALDQAWQDAMTLIKMCGGNARYLTFSAGRVPVDCADGQVAAGMCIDFYGRSQAEWAEKHVGRKVLVYHTPDYASSVSADTIGMFRGAPNKERAQMFIDFLLSKEGQQIWNNKIGTPNGPVKYTLHRMPVRRDLYDEKYKQYMTAPDADMFRQAENFTYKGSWTGPYFSLLRVLVKVMLIDCQQELKEAWKAIIQAGGPEKCPEAMAHFARIPFTHTEAADIARQLARPENQTVLMRQWGDFFRQSYADTVRAANGKGK